MKVSICIPTYNGSAYLEECLQSILAQIFTDFEILICDDYSTDNTIEIIKQFQQKDNRIKLFVNEKNLGLVGNWNRCIELAQGEWIKFVFQDDLILPNCLQEMMEATNKNKPLIVCEREFFFESNVSPQIKKKYDTVTRLYKELKTTQTQDISPKQASTLVNKYAPSNFIGEPTSVLFKKSAVKHLGLFREDINQLCDLEYWLRLSTNYGFVYIPNKLVNFRVHNLSTTQKNNSINYFSTFYSDKILIIYLLLFNPIYEAHRKNSSFLGLFRLHYALYYFTYGAEHYAKKNGLDIRKEMQLLKEKYPKINQTKNLYYLYLPMIIVTNIIKKILHK